MNNESGSRTEELLEVIAKALMAPVMDTELADAKSAKLYELTGKASQAKIIEKLSMSSATISSTWKRWERMGLIVKDGKTYRKVL